MTVGARLFQARMWREYAQVFDGRPHRRGITREWLEQIGRVSRQECLRRARVSLYLARRGNRNGHDELSLLAK